MQRINAIIIDDESMARQLLKGILNEHCPDINLLDNCEDLPKAVKSIRKHKPDVVFLDIDMPGHSGLELLEFFNAEEINFSIIFTTAYKEYAINAIKMHAFDYLLKPLDAEAVITVVDKFKKQWLIKHQQNNELKLGANKIAIPTSNGIRFIETEKIVYLKADSSYTEIHLIDNEKIIVSRTLKNFEEALKEQNNFFRCSKSHIVNYDFINEYIKSDGGYLVLKNKSNIPISPDKVDEFLELSKLVRR